MDAIILSLPLLIWYPITRASHAEMRWQLEVGETLTLSKKNIGAPAVSSSIDGCPACLW